MEGTQGMVYKITEELPNVQEQITSAISIVLEDYVEAQHLFHELLTNSVRFRQVLISFMNNFLMRLRSTSSYMDDTAWSIVSQCVKQFFSDIAAAKASDRDIRDIDDPSYTCAQYIWATLKAHAVMA
eukprot:14547705-Ditylum_brightwellii.AAC.1